jgi:hypothetical protein
VATRTFTRSVNVPPFESWEQLEVMEAFLHEQFGLEGYRVRAKDGHGDIKTASVAELRQFAGDDELPEKVSLTYSTFSDGMIGEIYWRSSDSDLAKMARDAARDGLPIHVASLDISGPVQREVVGVATVLQERLDSGRFFARKPVTVTSPLTDTTQEAHSTSAHRDEIEVLSDPPSSTFAKGWRGTWLRIQDATLAQTIAGVASIAVVAVAGTIYALF